MNTRASDSLISWNRSLLSRLACQKIPHISWNPKIRYRAHKSPSQSFSVLYACVLDEV
jgi:hypothetical protein